MPIPEDPNVPTVPEFIQAVSFRLLRNGESVELKDGTYYVDNISNLDAHLAVSSDPSTETDDDPGVSQAEVVIRSELDDDNKFQKRDRFVVRADTSQTVTKGTNRPADTWISYVYTPDFDPEPDIPCAEGLQDDRTSSLVLERAATLGTERLGVLIILDEVSSATLFSTEDTVDLEGTYRVLETNNSSDGCTLSAPLDSTWPVVGINFNPNDYPVAETGDRPAQVKVLWVSGYKSIVN